MNAQTLDMGLYFVRSVSSMYSSTGDKIEDALEALMERYFEMYDNMLLSSGGFQMSIEILIQDVDDVRELMLVLEEIRTKLV